MAGIFRSLSTTSANGHHSESTPNNKRLSFGAFCTSPGALQDVTMESLYGTGYRSPCVTMQYQGSTSPAGQGRSVREYEEQMTTLRKENFNLKLRLFFLEESLPGYQQQHNSNNASSDGQEPLIKQLIDSKVEKEILRKEIQEKQDILKEAALAMNQMEKMLKDTEGKYQSMVDDLKQKIQDLEMERDADKTNNGQFMNELLGRTDLSNSTNTLQKVRELEGNVKQSEDKVDSLQAEINKLDEILTKRDETIKGYEEKVKELVFANAELLESLENKDNDVKNAETQQLEQELQDQRAELADKACMLQDLEEKHKEQTQKYEHACRCIQELMKTNKTQQREINNLKKQTGLSESNSSHNKENSNVDSTAGSNMECTGLCHSLADSEVMHELVEGKTKRLEAIIEKHESTIKDLKVEIKKKTANLQHLVNKELWEKNREIERLTKILSSPVNSPTKNNNVSSSTANELQQSFNDAEYAKALERNKVLQRKVDILIQRLTVERNNEDLIVRLKREVRETKAETDRTKKWSQECGELCTLLSTRLEELAGFLNSLLKHKDVLGFLAADSRKAMRKAVDRSLDLSKSLNINLSLSRLSLGADQSSLAQLANLSEILMGDVELEDKTFNSHEDLQAMQSIETLKAENKALKKELDKRRVNTELKKERRSLPLSVEQLSESEAWSEPDRKVSMARIGLEDRKGTTHVRNTEPLVATDSESEAGLLGTAQNRSTRQQERISHLEQLITQRDERIIEIQGQLAEAENRLQKEQLSVECLTEELEDQRKRNIQIEKDFIELAASQPNEEECLRLKHQIDEKMRFIEKLQEEKERIVFDSRLVENKQKALQNDLMLIRDEHEAALLKASEEEKLKLHQLTQDMQQVLQQRLEEQERLQQEALQRDWIARSLYDETCLQLTELQQQYSEMQKNLLYLNENIQDLQEEKHGLEHQNRALSKQIDKTTEMASKCMEDRIRANSEKLHLEQKVEELSQQLHSLENERQNLQEQIHVLQNSRLDTFTTTASTVISAIHLQTSDVSQSGYTSEEVPQAHNLIPHTSSTSVQNSQRFNNSSPDLGIESDAGRVSSVELSNAQRVNLKTIEFTGNETTIKNEKGSEDTCANETDSKFKPEVNSTLANTTTPAVVASPTTATNTEQHAPHECAKVDQENAELKRKLIRTKRSLEETYQKLRISNQRKALVEKDIKNQILKTHNVLRNVRSNMENEM